MSATPAKRSTGSACLPRSAAGARQWVPNHVLEEARKRTTAEEDGIVDPAVEERRAARRRVISKRASAAVDTENPVDCLIVDISDTGGRLSLEGIVALPKRFELRCHKSARSWWVELAWQQGRAVGVRFCNPLDPPWTIKSGLGAWLIGEGHNVCIDLNAHTGKNSARSR